MGLLDDFTSFLKTPEGIGVASGLAGYAMNARKGTPWNNIGRGGMAGLIGYAQAQESQQQQMDNALMRQIRQQQIDEYTAKKLAIDNLPEDQRAMVKAGVPIQSIWKLNNPDLPEGMRNGQNGPEFIPGYIEGKKQISAATTQPYYTPIPTANGVVSFDNRTGGAKPIDLGGSPIIKSSDDPNLQGRITGAKTASKEFAEAGAKASIDLPKITAGAETTLKHINELRNHPGFSTAVGKSSMLQIQRFPGTDAYDFNNRLSQLKGGGFLQAIDQLRGTGQITEIEGAKATQAITRMDIATSEKEFNAALDDYEKIVRGSIDRAKQSAAGPVSYPSDAGKPGVKVPSGDAGRADILGKELALEQQKLAEAKASGNLKGISEANRNIGLLQKEIGQKPIQQQSVRKYNPATGRIE